MYDINNAAQTLYYEPDSRDDELFIQPKRPSSIRSNNQPTQLNARKSLLNRIKTAFSKSQTQFNTIEPIKIAKNNEESSFLTYQSVLVKALGYIDKHDQEPPVQIGQLEKDILTPRISNHEIKLISPPGQSPGLSNKRSKMGAFSLVKKGKIVRINFKRQQNRLYFKLDKAYIAAKTFRENFKTTKTEEDQRSLFLNEVAVIKNCRHENILKYYGVVLSLKWYLITEWCSGPNLFKFLRHNFRENWIDARMIELVQYCLDIAKGLNYLHENRIIHRDLKSDNVLLFPIENASPTGFKYIAKIADFGLAVSPVHSYRYQWHLKHVVGAPYWYLTTLLGLYKFNLYLI